MASTRQIENLERKHRENPEGLTFAPLANAYRNSGQPERAIEILTLGLEHHPEHAPARIVLGRCHVDLGDDSAAEAAFTKVLELDQENVVALKALADITERGERYPDSIRWLEYLLEVDRNNDEARDQLARVTEAAESHQPEETSPLPAAAEPDPDATEGEPTAEVASGTIGGISPFEPPIQPPAADVAVDTPAAEAEEEASPVPTESPWAHPLAGSSGTPAEADEPAVEEPSPWVAPTEAEPASVESADTLSSSWEPPALTPEVVDGFEAAEFEGPGGPDDGVAAIDGLESAVFEAPEEPGGGSSALDGLESAVFEGPGDADDSGDAEGLRLVGEDSPDGEVTVEKGEDIVLRAAQDNEYQMSSAAEELSLEAAGEGEYQVSNAPEDIVLRPSGANEYQGPQDSELLGSIPDDTEPADGAQVEESVEPEPVSSWFAPAEEDPIPEAVSQPDGTAERLESNAESDVPPFEEVEPLPSAWSPAEGGTATGDPFAPAAAEEPESSVEPASSEKALPPEEVPAGAEADGLAPSGSREVETEEASTPVEARAAELESTAAPVEEEAEADVESYDGTEPELVATETMAELYLSQGHRYEALGVYRILWRETPDDQRLKEKVEALESELERATSAEAASEAMAESAWDEVTVSDTEEPARDYAASKTGGQRARAFFKNLLAARPSAPPEPPEAPAVEGSEEPSSEVVGEPTRPADDRLSLSAVFGEDPSPVPPAVAGTAEQTDEASVEGFSFDSFFGGERGDPGRRRPASRRARSQEDEADLDQFHSWLQGLKG